MNSKRMEVQARWGDILLALGGSEGVLFLANVYHDAGKPVVPLNRPMASTGSPGSPTSDVYKLPSGPNAIGS